MLASIDAETGDIIPIRKKNPAIVKMTNFGLSIHTHMHIAYLSMLSAPDCHAYVFKILLSYFGPGKIVPLLL
jgi:hypothetical protein